MSENNAEPMASIELDISREKCPMTFVRTRLLLESMHPGEVAKVLVSQGEALDNLPESVASLGHRVLSIRPEPGHGVYTLMIRAA